MKQVEERSGVPDFGDTLPPNKGWTHRFRETGQPPVYELFAQLWLSPELAKRQSGAFILRRTKVTRAGTDHDPAWVALDL